MKIRSFISKYRFLFLAAACLIALIIFGAKLHHRDRANKLISQLELIEPLDKEQKKLIHSLDLETIEWTLKHFKETGIPVTFELRAYKGRWPRSKQPVYLRFGQFPQEQSLPENNQ